MEITVGKQWTLKKKLGSGSFGEVYIGKHCETGHITAIKLERDIKDKKTNLKKEYEAYKKLNDNNKDSKYNIPKYHYYNREGDYNVLVIDYFEYNLSELKYKDKDNYNLKNVLIIADQLINTLEYIHDNNIIHRDLSRKNIMYNLKDNNIYIIDFGISKVYFNKKNNTHINMTDKKTHIGTYKYNSINSMNLKETSRRDDLESLGYILIKCLKDGLPWDKIKDPNKIREMKIQSIETGELFENCPEEFKTYINYCRKLDFIQRPDYNYLRTLFKNLFLKNQYGSFDLEFNL
jgi:serine/threonine protein kinase